VKRFSILALQIVGVLLLVDPAIGAKPPPTWDGLVQVRSKNMDLVYLQPGADFRGYTKVMIDPTEVAFRKNWRRDYNAGNRSLSSRVSERDVENAISAGITASHDIFTKAWADGGYTIVNEPGPDVLRVMTGIVNISVNAPDTQTAARSHSFANEAGEATLFVEAKDSMTGALLGRAVDRRIAGENGVAWRTRVSNRGDFRDLVQDWARTTVRGMTELKALSPIRN
jgi:hypothetical protein